jgi:hypothetical protein
VTGNHDEDEYASIAGVLIAIANTAAMDAAGFAMFSSLPLLDWLS